MSIVERAIDPDPARRFASAGEMEAALRRGLKTISNSHHPDIGRVASTERTSLQKWSWLVWRLPLGLTVELLGLVASRSFEFALGNRSGFVAGPREYLRLARALSGRCYFWTRLCGLGILGGCVLCSERRSRRYGDDVRRYDTLDGESWHYVLLSGRDVDRDQLGMPESLRCYGRGLGRLDRDPRRRLWLVVQGAISLHGAHST